MTKLIIWGIVIYLIYKVIFELVVPVTKATSKMRDTIKEMQQQQANQQAAAQKQQAAKPQQQATTAASKDADYIDFEEVK